MKQEHSACAQVRGGARKRRCGQPQLCVEHMRMRGLHVADDLSEGRHGHSVGSEHCEACAMRARPHAIAKALLNAANWARTTQSHAARVRARAHAGHNVCGSGRYACRRRGRECKTSACRTAERGAERESSPSDPLAPVIGTLLLARRRIAETKNRRLRALQSRGVAVCAPVARGPHRAGAQAGCSPFSRGAYVSMDTHERYLILHNGSKARRPSCKRNR